jgi:GH24 family phage-related lysozyme (muramidase)
MKKLIQPLIMSMLVVLSFYSGIGFHYYHLSKEREFITDTAYKYVEVGNLYSTAINFLKKKEGFCSKPTVSCDGRLTIGYGHVIKEGEMFSIISEQEATDILKKDLEIALNFVKKETKVGGNKALALSLLAFNLGNNRFLKYLKEDSLLTKNNIERIRRYCHYKIFKEGHYLNVKSKALQQRREFELFIYKCYDF